MERIENLVMRNEAMVVKFTVQEFPAREGGSPILSYKVALDLGENEDLLTVKCVKELYKTVSPGTPCHPVFTYTVGNDGRKDIKVTELLPLKPVDQSAGKKADKQ